MNQIDNEPECRVRELLAYLDDALEIEEALRFPVAIIIEKMRAARFAEAARAKLDATVFLVHQRSRFPLLSRLEEHRRAACRRLFELALLNR
jgi:hypothetical protein